METLLDWSAVVCFSSHRDVRPELRPMIYLTHLVFTKSSTHHGPALLKTGQRASLPSMNFTVLLSRRNSPCKDAPAWAPYCGPGKSSKPRNTIGHRVAGFRVSVPSSNRCTVAELGPRRLDRTHSLGYRVRMP